MMMPGRKFSMGEYRYGFNGKENDNEVKGEGSQQDYGMRIYDPRLEKFLTVDPLFQDYPWNSSYAFAENDVVRSVDLDGLEKYIYSFIKGKDGKWTTTELELPKPGPLGGGALVFYNGNNVNSYFYGNQMPTGTGGKEFVIQFEDKKVNKEGLHEAYKVPGESFTTIGYGHANQSRQDSKKYPLGTTITEEQARQLFKEDFNKRALSVYDQNGLNRHKSDALSSFAYNSFGDAERAAKKFNSSDPETRGTFIIANLRARDPKHLVGLAKRRSAEQIIYSFGKYFQLDYQKNEKTQQRYADIYVQYTLDLKKQDE
jgi:RHS repeat-associated protein